VNIFKAVDLAYRKNGLQLRDSAGLSPASPLCLPIRGLGHLEKNILLLIEFIIPGIGMKAREKQWPVISDLLSYLYSSNKFIFGSPWRGVLF
jgi:hypothetical protein